MNSAKKYFISLLVWLITTILGIYFGIIVGALKPFYILSWFVFSIVGFLFAMLYSVIKDED